MAWAEQKVAGVVTVDIKGAFNGIQEGRLSYHLRSQGWPPNITHWVISFMEQREVTLSLDGIKLPSVSRLVLA